jgi:hypothetical protein
VAFNLAGAGTGFVGGALSGAALTGFNPLGIAAGGLIGGFMGNKAGAKKKKAPGYTPIPYSGARPPSIDVNGTNYLRGTQAETQDIIQSRARGEGVGYSPEWMNASKQLINSNEADRVRAAQGSLSAQGLSGNARAAEATTGRERQYTADELAKLTIADMERKNQERDVNTSRLQALNLSNFGQENTGAQFDLNKWNAENDNARMAAGLDASNYWNQEEVNNRDTTEMGDFATSVFSPSAKGLTMVDPSKSGQGIAPSASAQNLAGYGSAPSNFGVFNPYGTSTSPLKKKFSF